MNWFLRNYYLFEIKHVFSRYVAFWLLSTVSLITIIFSSRLSFKYAMASSRARLSNMSIRILKLHFKNRDVYSTKFIQPGSSTELGKIGKRLLIICYPLKSETGEIIRKGIIFIKFSETVTRLLEADCMKALSKEFEIVIEPSWSGYGLEQFLFLETELNTTVYFLTSATEDKDLLEGISDKLIPINLGSGSWVDPRIFFNKEVTREYDLVMVANYHPIKRVHRFFEIISRNEFGIKAALVCAGHGSERKLIQDYLAVNHYPNLEIFEDLSQNQLNTLLNKAKYNCLLTLKEGSNRSLYEGAVAGAIPILVESNVGVDKQKIDEIGYVLPLSEISEFVLNTYPENYSLKKPAMSRQHLGSINAVIEIVNKHSGSEYNISEIAQKVNNPEMQYYDSPEVYSKERNDKYIEKLLTTVS